mgnify:CR=1 FL=1
MLPIMQESDDKKTIRFASNNTESSIGLCSTTGIDIVAKGEDPEEDLIELMRHRIEKKEKRIRFMS